MNFWPDILPQQACCTAHCMVIVSRMSLLEEREHDAMTWTAADKKKKKRLDEMRDKESEDAMSRTPPLPAHSRHASSKYDFVKVRVWLGDNADHYYVLSRFLVSRMLTVTKIPNHVAIKISLELKKLLIDNSLFDVSQSDLEANLFKLMERRSYGEEYINRYKMMTRFHHQRVPLVILVCGTACVGKSTVATQLAQRLNLPNVLQTDMVYELIRTSTDAPLAAEPICEREFESREDLVTEFARECRILRKGLNGDLKKAMKDGKPIIIEGIHLDPSIYLMDEDCNANTAQRMSSMSLGTDLKAHSKDCKDPSTLLPGQNDGSRNLDPDVKNCETDTLIRHSDDSTSGKGVFPACEEQSEVVPQKVSNGLIAGSHGNVEESTGDSLAVKQPKKPATKAIIVPIVLRMDEFDHKTLLEEWIACRSATAPLNEAKKEALINRLMTIQDYLCSFKSQGIIVRNVSATTFPQTLDALHSYLLQRIEECQSRKDNCKGENDPS